MTYLGPMPNHDLTFARVRGQQALQGYHSASHSFDLVPTQATQHQHQGLQWLDDNIDDAVSQLDSAVSHPTEEAYRLWQVLYGMKTVLESASAGGRDPAIWDEDFGAASFGPDMQFLLHKFKLYLKDVASWIARTLDKKDAFESDASAARGELQDAQVTIQQKDEALTEQKAENQAMRGLLAHQELLLAQFVHQGASTSGMVLMAINSGSPLDHQLKEEPDNDKSLAPPPEDLASAAGGPTHVSNAALTEAAVVQPVHNPALQPSADAELEPAVETISQATKSEAHRADPVDDTPAKSAPPLIVKPATQLSAVQTAEPVVAVAPTSIIAPDAVMSVQMSPDAATSVQVPLAESAAASPVTPSSSFVESAAPVTPSWAIEARHVPSNERVGSPSPDSTHTVQSNGPALDHRTELAVSNDTMHKAHTSCSSEAMRASKGWAMPILRSIKGSRTGAEELWTTLQSSPREDVSAVCNASLGTSPRVDGFINKLLRRTSNDLAVVSTPASQCPTQPVINPPQPKPAAHPSVAPMAAEQVHW